MPAGLHATKIHNQAAWQKAGLEDVSPHPKRPRKTYIINTDETRPE
jgi:hypothetical protein